MAQYLLSLSPVPAVGNILGRSGFALGAALAFVGATTAAGSTGSTELSPTNSEHGFAYLHEENREVPWSIHVVKIQRNHREFRFGTTLGGGQLLGMSVVSEQLKNLPAELGTPVAAVNGDFYLNDKPYPGDPRDLQIHEGEVVSAPNGHACFWLDAAGEPHATNVQSRFRVQWPDGPTLPMGLNEARESETAVLYSAANGTTTRTSGGREYVLEGRPGSPWLPLRVGQTLSARVRNTGEHGDSPLSPDTLVLSLGSKLAAHTARLAPGAMLTLLIETLPDLSGVNTALGGGPTLVRDGKAMEWSGFLMRHPRTALGWNRETFFLVEVDGRQSGLSAGMTLSELAAYTLKLGCDQALNLDGGGSATIWVYGHVMNSPSEGQERPGANALVIFRKPGTGAVPAPQP